MAKLLSNVGAQVTALMVILGTLGCASLLEKDFQKATPISEVQLGNPKPYSRTLVPPTGEARLILVVPNYRCAPPVDGAVSLSARTNERPIMSERKRLSELTWSYGEGSCEAYGYIAGSAGRIDLKDVQVPVTFDIDVSQVKAGTTSGASVWLIYGDRVPAARIFGAKK